MTKLQNRSWVLGLVVAGFALSVSAYAATRQVSDLKLFGALAVQDEGRIKPLDTYARNLLLQFSGKRTFNGKPAVHWLARVVFTPEATRDDKVFLINSPEIPMAIGIETDSHRRYSFDQLEHGMSKIKSLALAAEGIEAKDRGLVDQEVLRLYNNLSIYLRLRSTFSFMVAHEDFAVQRDSVKALLRYPASRTEFSFWDIALTADAISEATKPLEQKKSASWSDDDKEMMRLLRNLYQWSQKSEFSPLAIVPPPHAGHETWTSPRDSARTGLSDPELGKEFTLLARMVNAYRGGEQLEFNIAAKAYASSVQKRVEPGQAKVLARLPLELFYNQANFFRYAWAFYLLAFFAFLFSLVKPGEMTRKIGFALLIAGFVPHVTAMLTRIIIMSRPPVTNLYETFIFVGVVCVLLGIIGEIFNRKWLGIVTASIAGFVFLAVADKFSAEGDTLRMLVAVLNSNFWLSTHVLSITIGYAGASVAGIIGHVYIIQALARPKDKAMLETTLSFMLGALGFGLTMSFFGTMLGGIWADQSWGRFWGWDPKENGALLIVLWSAALFHARAGRMLNPLGVAVGAALGLIVVMWAWLGVNLLSIGLHSYGFTSGLATNLAVYIAFELLFLGVSIFWLGKKGIPV